MTQVLELHCAFTEGSIALPTDNRGQAVNILIPLQRSPLSISRNQLHPYESFENHLAHECEMLKKGQTLMRRLEVLTISGLTMQIFRLASTYALNEQDKKLLTNRLRIVFSNLNRIGTEVNTHVESGASL